MKDELVISIDQFAIKNPGRIKQENSEYVEHELSYIYSSNKEMEREITFKFFICRNEDYTNWQTSNKAPSNVQENQSIIYLTGIVIDNPKLEEVSDKNFPEYQKIFEINFINQIMNFTPNNITNTIIVHDTIKHPERSPWIIIKSIEEITKETYSFNNELDLCNLIEEYNIKNNQDIKCKKMNYEYEVIQKKLKYHITIEGNKLIVNRVYRPLGTYFKDYIFLEW
jgi:hypothetical protein